MVTLTVKAQPAVDNVHVIAERHRRHQSSVGVIGLGYVGLPLALAACRSGFRTVGFDIDPEKIIALNEDRSYLSHVPSETLAGFRQSGMFAVTGDFRRLAEVLN